MLFSTEEQTLGGDALELAATRPDELVWFVDGTTFAVAWGTLPFRDALEDHGIGMTYGLPHAALFPDALTRSAWADIYDVALETGFASAHERLLGGRCVDVTVVAVPQRRGCVDLVAFGHEVTARCRRRGHIGRPRPRRHDASTLVLEH